MGPETLKGNIRRGRERTLKIRMDFLPFGSARQSEPDVR